MHSTAAQLSNHIKRTVAGPMWHGPSLDELLASVSSDQAAARPIAGAHSIWEIVLHVTAWAEIALARLNKCIKPFEPALAHRIGHTRKHSERLRQLLSGELFRCATHLDGLGNGGRKIFRLFNQAFWTHFICFGRIDEIEPKEVLVRAGTHMKTVAVIRRIRNQLAIFQHNPLFRSVSRITVDRCGPKKSDANERAYTGSRENRKIKGQSGTSNSS